MEIVPGNARLVVEGRVRSNTIVHLKPGMPADFFVKTRQRPIVVYLIEPATSVVRKAMHET